MIKDLTWTIAQKEYRDLPAKLLGKEIPQFFNSMAAGGTAIGAQAVFKW